MKSFLSIALLISLAAFAQAKTYTCSLSGDPHFISYDNAKYDFQGSGWFVVTKFKGLEVQCQFAKCNNLGEAPIAKMTDFRNVQCMNSCKVRAKPDGQTCESVVTFRRQDNNKIKVNGNEVDIAQKPMTVDGTAIRWDSNKLKIAFALEGGSFATITM